MNLALFPVMSSVFMQTSKDLQGFFYIRNKSFPIEKCSMRLLTSCFHSHRRIITKQECCYSVMGGRLNGFLSPLSTPFLPPIPSDDQLDLNG